MSTHLPRSSFLYTQNDACPRGLFEVGLGCAKFWSSIKVPALVLEVYHTSLGNDLAILGSIVWLKMVKTGRKLLPPCEGPKLEPFRYPNKPIEFLDILSDPFAEVSSSSAIHSHVFRVRIHRTDFALKIVGHHRATTTISAYFG